LNVKPSTSKAEDIKKENTGRCLWYAVRQADNSWS